MWKNMWTAVNRAISACEAEVVSFDKKNFSYQVTLNIGIATLRADYKSESSFAQIFLDRCPPSCKRIINRWLIASSDSQNIAFPKAKELDTNSILQLESFELRFVEFLFYSPTIVIVHFYDRAINHTEFIY